MNINAIVNDFQAIANFSNDNEVALFRKLAKCICKHSNSTFIDETHGKVAQVEFTSRINGKGQCEISDLLIVLRNVRTNEYRATFWQAKKEKAPKWPAPRGISNFDFTAQFNQWELLSHRPKVKGLANFKPHPEVLQKAASPSIGSLGVFYEDNGNVEVNYSVAEMVSASTIAKHPRMIINEMLSKYMAWHGEVIVRNNTATFLDAVSLFTIGALINPTSPSDKWLINYVSGKCKRKGITNFFDDDSIDNTIDSPISDDDGISMLLINSESDPTRQ